MADSKRSKSSYKVRKERLLAFDMFFHHLDRVLFPSMKPSDHVLMFHMSDLYYRAVWRSCLYDVL